LLFFLTCVDKIKFTGGTTLSRPDREWKRFHGTISPTVKAFLESQAESWGVEVGTALDVIVWRNCLRPSFEDWERPGKIPQDILERSFAEDALDALLDPVATRLLEEMLFRETDEAQGGRRRKTQVLLKRWRRFRRIDPLYKSDVLEVMHAMGKEPTIETMSTIDIHDWCFCVILRGDRYSETLRRDR
jgi:hypothetical protein